jgi:hypothetical protein
VFYHTSQPIEDRQQVSVEIYEISWREHLRRLVTTVPVPLSKGSTLEWAAFDIDSGP